MALAGWERFGTRHIFLWMFSLAASTFVFQCLKAFENSLHGAAWERNDAFSASSVPSTLVAMSAGTILGLALPVILTGPKGSFFLDHPARVLFTLFASLTLLDLVARCLSSSMSSVLGTMNELAIAAGIIATGFIWSVYALVRPRIGWIWRFAMLLCCLALANDFAYLCQVISASNAVGGRLMPPSCTQSSPLVAPLQSRAPFLLQASLRSCLGNSGTGAYGLRPLFCLCA